MPSANSSSTPQHHRLSPDAQRTPAGPLSIMDDLADPDSDLTSVERSAIIVLWQLVRRRARAAVCRS